MQLQIELCKVNFAYFYVFSSSGKESMLCFVPKNEEFIKNLLEVLNSKFKQVILPEIVTRQMDIDTPNERKVYYSCRRPEFGPMIACDDKSCKTEW